MNRALLHKIRANTTVQELTYSLFAILFAMILGLLTLYLFGYDIKQASTAFYHGCFGNSYNLAQVFLRATPLIFTGLAVAIGFQAGLFNIGGEGQLYFGALATAVVALHLPMFPRHLLIFFSLSAGFLAGGLWGFLAGCLKALTGAHEVITTIMLNYIGFLTTSFLLHSFFKAQGPVSQTARIPENARLFELVEFTRLTSAIFLGVLVILLAEFFFRKTSLGYAFLAVGKNPEACEYAGISQKKMTLLAMFLSGGVAGLAGSTIVLGVLHRFIANFSPGYGFTGIAVAVLGRNTPLGVLLAALLFGALEQGGASMQLMARIPADLMIFVQGLVILFVAAPALFRRLGFRKRKEKST